MFDDFFAQQGEFAPGFSFANVGDAVQGEILSVTQQDQTDINDPTGQTKILDKKTGQPKQQLKVVLQTELRNWAGVSKVPNNRDPQNPQPLPPSEDDGKRAIYVKGWMIGAVGDAVEKATGRRGGPAVGGMLAVRHSGTRPAPGKPQPIKLYEAHYQAPAVGTEMFNQPQAQQSFQQPAAQPQAQPQQQPATQPQQQGGTPWGQPQQGAPAQPAAQPAAQPQQPAQADPWASSFGAQPNF